MLHFIAGDIGGTNSRLQLWRRYHPSENRRDPIPTDPIKEAENAIPTADTIVTPLQEKEAEQEEVLIAEQTYPSQKYASLTFVIEKFLKEVFQTHNLHVDDYPVACCLAVAGPVRANKATITNVNWVLDGAEMSRQLNIKDFLIINDFVGIGYGLLALQRKDVIAINEVPLAADAPKACIGAGTGLGQVFLTAGHLNLHGDDDDDDDDTNSVDTEYNVWASEGGHADFAPRDSLEFGLLEYFKTNERVTRVSVERIVSGKGIPGIYNYFAHLHPEEVNPEVTHRLLTEDPGAVIAEFAENGKCTLCRQSIELFIKCYGAEAGNMALKTLPFGGMYIAGGIAPKLKHFMLRNNLFWEHFVKKGRMQAILEKVPLFMITNPSVGLLGAKVVCRRLVRHRGFLPGRGELATFTEATPRSLSSPFNIGETFAYSDLNESNAFETEVTLEPTTAKPEKVVIRRRDPSAADHSERRSTRITRREQNMKTIALTYGIVGGAIASIATVASLAMVNYLRATTSITRRRPDY